IGFFRPRFLLTCHEVPFRLNLGS
ncbi:hypothetical protein CCACVL1_05071, partial [Corchorus capsularis]